MCNLSNKGERGEPRRRTSCAEEGETGLKKLRKTLDSDEGKRKESLRGESKP